jgi:hypothetical protein
MVPIFGSTCGEWFSGHSNWDSFDRLEPGCVGLICCSRGASVGAQMAGDPRECRGQAASCWVLAETADEQERQRLSDLACAWEQLAVEHENAQAFLRTMEAVNEGLKADTAAPSPTAPHEDGRRLTMVACLAQPGLGSVLD